MNTKLKVALVAILVIAIGGAYKYPQVQEVVQQPFGAAAGPEHYNREYFNQGITFGGRVATTTTAGTYTTIAKDFAGTPSYLDWLPNTNVTVSLSSTSTLALVPKIGDVAKIMIRNASSTANSSITFAAVDANLDLQFDEATGGDLVLNGLDWGELTIIHEDTYLVSVMFHEFTEAD